MVTAIDVVILPTEPVKSLAIALSKKLNGSGFCLSETDVLPHITLAIGFVENVDVARKKIAEIMKNFAPFELIVERMEGRYLIVKKGAEMEKLHRQITVQTDFVNPEGIEKAYFVQLGEEISQETLDYTNNFKRENSFGNWIPHITFGWDDKADFSKLKARFPLKFTANEVAICQLGDKNTCRKVLARIPLD